MRSLLARAVAVLAVAFGATFAAQGVDAHGDTQQADALRKAVGLEDDVSA